MKSPKLLCFFTLFLLFLLIAVNAQVVTVPRLTSALRSGNIVVLCESDTVTLTATGDSGPTALDVEFMIDRGGMIIYPLGTGRQPIASFLLHSNKFFAGVTFFHLNQPNI